MKSCHILIILTLLSHGDIKSQIPWVDQDTNSYFYLYADTFYLDTLFLNEEAKEDSFEYSGWKGREGIPALFYFIIVNKTNRDIELWGSASCGGCVMALGYNKLLSPMESTPISYKLKTDGRRGGCSKLIYVNYRQKDTEQEFRTINGKLTGLIE